MICTVCRRLAVRRTLSLHVRSLTTVSSTPNAAPSTPPPSIDNATSATSSKTAGISQPLSVDQLPSTSSAKTGSAGGIKDISKAKLQGSIPGGAELKGLAYLKAKPYVLAKEDDEYPDWLWTLLDEGKQADGNQSVDLSTLTKKQRAKYERKQEKMLKDVPKPIPLHEQSKDLTEPGASAQASLSKRLELTKSSRDARRKGIRESNFLKGM